MLSTTHTKIKMEFDIYLSLKYGEWDKDMIIFKKEHDEGVNGLAYSSSNAIASEKVKCMDENNVDKG